MPQIKKTCERCDQLDIPLPERKERGPLELESGRTDYMWEGEGTDPTRDILLCRFCAQIHHEYWDELWNTFYRR